MATLENRLKSLESKKFIGGRTQSNEAIFKAEYQVNGAWIDGWDFDAIAGESFNERFTAILNISLGKLVIAKKTRHRVRHLLAWLNELHEAI